MKWRPRSESCPPASRPASSTEKRLKQWPGVEISWARLAALAPGVAKKPESFNLFLSSGRKSQGLALRFSAKLTENLRAALSPPC